MDTTSLRGIGKSWRNALKLQKLANAHSNEILAAVVPLSNKKANDRNTLNDGNKQTHNTIAVQNN